MDTTPAFAGLACPDCGNVGEPTVADRCPDCGSVLSVSYERDGTVTTESFSGAYDDQRRFAPFLPFAPEGIVSLGEGGTPLVSCPDLAEELGVARVLCKDEGRNPTGSTVDRGLSLAVTAATKRDRSPAVLPTTGHAGQSAAAYAGRAGIDSRSFVPTRSSHLTKAMINVHGGDMNVVEGRFPNAVDAFEEWVDGRAEGRTEGENIDVSDGDDGDGRTGGDGGGDTDSGNDAGTWADVGPASPFRREGAKLLVHELCAQLGWEPPDALVVPTGHGVGLAGAHAAVDELLSNDLIDATPSLVAAQPDGCAPIVRAVTEAEAFGAWERPDTIAGSLEVPDPARGREAVLAVTETGGEAVAVPDEALLANAVDDTAATGVELGTAGGVGVAGARALADEFDEDDTVVVVNPASGSKESDVLRSELMSRGQ